MSDDKTDLTTPVNNQKTSTKKNQPSRFVNTLSLFVVIAIGASVFLWHQSMTQYRKLLSQQKVLQTTLSSATNTIDKLQTEYNSTQTQQHTQIKQSDKQQQQINHLRVMLTQGEPVWYLLRIDHLIRLANYQALFLHDTPGTIALLKAATQELKQANKPQWLPLSTALHQDIEALQVAAAVNVNDVLSQLNALDSQLSQLPLTVAQFGQANMKKAQAIVVPETNTKDSLSWWKEKSSALWQQLRGILVIRHDDKAIIPIIDAQQQAYLRQNLHLIMFQAKWAVINHDNALYHSSLDQFIQWINDYFNTQSAVTKMVLVNIAALQKVTLTEKLPALTASLAQVQRLLTTVSSAPVANTPPVTAPTNRQPKKTKESASIPQPEVIDS